ncbi:sensor histidine kinase [Dethiosulfatarculus sandiegensis]|uniref:histidine kinase n=1 Tax=Dethiosulfatarculus sandiegensis TaxID=1429043 RepID=A0A0D2JWY5_9BACT|nr:sensor histidine kinase [Dethiosulfatarculus sandiegensis]KIX14070.1 histidine kinase [Dethiosulfatarculus sandiegensis]
MQEKKNHYQVLRNKVLALLIIVPLIPFIVALAIGYSYFTKSLENNNVDKIKRIAEDHRAMIQMFLDERKSDLNLIAETYSYQELIQPDNLGAALLLLKEKSGAFVDLGLFDEKGNHLAYKGPYKLSGKNYAKEQWFKKAVTSQYFISDVFLGFRRIPHFIIAITQKKNGHTWVLRATIDTYLFSEMVRKVRIGKSGEAYILNNEGIFQTLRRSGGELLTKSPDDDSLLKPHQGTISLLKADTKGEEYLYATCWLNDDNWLLIVRQGKEDAFQALNDASIQVILICILGIVFIIGLAFYITNRLITQIEKAETDKEKLDQQLIVAGRLAEIGEMSAGFAHEINNPLQVIRAEQKLMETIMQEMVQKGDLLQGEDLNELIESLNQIQIQIDRCAQITQSVLKFARKTDPNPQRLNLADFVGQASLLFSKKAQVSGVSLELKNTSQPCWVNADPGQLQQVVLNLLNNAFDAVEAKYGGQGEGLVTVNVEALEAQALLSIKDNGKGINSEDLKRIFTPFFTTKPVGQGTGLGLPVCYGIVEKMGGSIKVQSTLGKGSTFIITLPLID